MRRRAQWWAACLWLALAASAVQAEKINDIRATNYLTDLAQVVNAGATQQVNALCAEVEHKTGAQIAVVTVKSLEGRAVEDYAVDLYKHLGVGQKDNRGVLLLLAPPERKYRIEVGYGLEPVINDARAGDIGRAMVPSLRQGNYSAAVILGVQRLAALIAADRGVTLDNNPAEVRSEEPSSDNSLPVWAIVILIFGATAFLRFVSRIGGRRRRNGGWWWMGPMGGWGGGWGSGGGSMGGGWGGSSGGFGGFGGGLSGGGGASGSW